MSGPAGQEFKKLPFKEISRPTTGDQPIAVVAGPEPEWPLRPIIRKVAEYAVNFCSSPMRRRGLRSQQSVLVTEQPFTGRHLSHRSGPCPAAQETRKLPVTGCLANGSSGRLSLAAKECLQLSITSGEQQQTHCCQSPHRRLSRPRACAHQADLIRQSFAFPSFTMETSGLRPCDELKVSPVLLHHLPSHEFPLLNNQSERSNRTHPIPVPQ